MVSRPRQRQLTSSVPNMRPGDTIPLAILGEQSRDGRFKWGEFDEITLAAQARGPIGDPQLNVSARAPAPRDSSLGRWGRRNGDMATWVDVNCLRGCLATMMQRGIEQVPDPTPLFRSQGDAWREAYNDELTKRLGVRLEEIPFGGCPPIGRVRWIAALHAGNVNHAVVVNGQGRILHDPNGHELNGLPVPRDRLLFGLRVVPANAPKTDRWGKAIR
jgi:hypothetical protein